MLAWSAACSEPSQPPVAATAVPASAQVVDESGPEALPPDGALEDVGAPPPLDDFELTGAAVPLVRQWTGDLDGMVERRYIRALVVPTRTQYWLENGQESGIEYELLKAFERQINRDHPHKQKNVKTYVVFVPTSRDDLIPALVEGRGDLAAGVLTVTPERQAQIDFGAPFAEDVNEIVVTGPRSAPVARIEDLSGREVFVRESSSYWTHLEEWNARLGAAGLAPIRLVPAPEQLQDDDVLEMLQAGLIDATVVDRYVAKLWSQILPDLRLLETPAVHGGGKVAWMMRKDSPKLRASVDAFARKHRQGSLLGNTLIKKYIGSTRFVKPATSPAELAKLERTFELFETFGDRYKLDALLLAAQGYQESRLDQSTRSPVGAIGVMQIMPATGKELGVGDITKLDSNIHAGAKYMRFMIDRYYADEPMSEIEKMLFAFASYNAGPARIRALRAKTQKRGLDPNRWFNHVEIVAAGEIGPETVTYVANIYKYYVAYTLVSRQAALKPATVDKVGVN